MSFSIGIVGLPNAGKSTLFFALTKKQVDIAAYPFTTINPNVGTVAVPDSRLERLARALNPPKTVPTIIEFIDIAGLVRGAHKGEGLGNQFLSHIRECDAILHLIRGFQDEAIEHVEGRVSPQQDRDIVNTELILKDLETAERLLEKIKKGGKSEKTDQKQIAILDRIHKALSAGQPINQSGLKEQEFPAIQSWQFLTLKPVVYVLNTDDKENEEPSLPHPIIKLNVKLEAEIAQLSDKESQELNLRSELDRLISACYNSLDLITFFTVAGGKELRAWTTKRGSLAPEAGRQVHSDFQDKFIRASAISWDKLISAGSWTKAQSLGYIKTVGKDYALQDGDVIEFKI